MTNRDVFNTNLRREVEEKLVYFEGLSNEELVKYTLDSPAGGVRVVIYDELRFFKVESTHRGCGSAKDVIAWLGEESESINGSNE